MLYIDKMLKLASVFLLLVAIANINEVVGQGPPATVPDIDLPNYLGLWYQMYANAFVFNTFERDNVCVTANYGLNMNGTVSVVNNATIGTPGSNKTSSIQGYAFQDNPTTDPGKLTVVFPSVPNQGEYWIIKLGPIEDTLPNVPQYQYSIVTDSRRVSLFILARDVNDFNSRFKDEALQNVEQEGFTRFYNAPIETVQTPECVYGEITKPNRDEIKSKKAIKEELKRILFHN